MTGESERTAPVDPIVARMVECLREEFDPERILLFGSRARGDAGEGSDVDLLVVMPDGTDRRETAIRMRGAAARLSGVPLASATTESIGFDGPLGPAWRLPPPAAPERRRLHFLARGDTLSDGRSQDFR